MSSKQATPPLHRLSGLVGILPGFRDVWGKAHETSDETRRALLAAMGIAAETDAEIEAAISDWLARPWRESLPPVQVETVDTPIRITLRIPAQAIGQPHRWCIVFEDGTRREEGFLPKRLQRLNSASVKGDPWTAFALALPPVSEPGYHRLEVWREGATALAMSLIVCPTGCYLPEPVQEADRVWGPAIQLYGVRSQRNWGIGDYADLRHLVEWAAANGAGIVGVSPLHSLFPHNPAHASPYSPSSRQFLNVLYLAVDEVPEFAECDEALEAVSTQEFQAQLRALRAAALVDYAEVGRTKFRVLEMLYRHFREHHLAADSSRARAFREFQAQGGDELAHFCLYHGLQDSLFAGDANLWGWPVWPEAFRDPGSHEVRTFAAAHPERIEYHAWLQWLAHEQLERIGRRSLDLGLGIGLFQDLAVGVDIGGAEAWTWRALHATAARVGCPPDEFNPLGQDWGVPPWIPDRLRDSVYAPYIAMLRANMTHSGALRIDHVMGLMRLFWFARGAVEGAYVAYPFKDLLRILALESQRNRCLVVGEDLGTVPDEVIEALRSIGVLSYRVLLLARDADGAFLPAADYPEQALVAATTHDLPTLSGFWRGLDLDVRTALNLYPDEDTRAAHIVRRAQDRARLLVALEREQLLPDDVPVQPVAVPEMTPALARAVLRCLARSPSKIALVQAEDMLGEAEQANLPGTMSQHPNWQRKLSLNLEEWPGDTRIGAMVEALVAERGRAVRAQKPATRILRPHAPLATYRLQFNRDFTFSAARDLVPYLAELGVSHCYCSPYLKARPGSQHGYDITDHTSLNPEVGSEADFEGFCGALAEHGMSQLLDFVPNHMGVMGAENAWWLNLLEHGEASPYAEFFDVDWHPIKPGLHGKVLLPVLGDHYGNIVDRGELKLAFDENTGEFSLWYGQHRFPIDPREYPRILLHRLNKLGARLEETHPVFLEYQSLATAFSHLPPRSESRPEILAERHRDSAIQKRQLAELHARSPDIQQFLRENLELFNGHPGEPGSFDLLRELVDAQAYRLANWRVASDEINYRRFFDVNELAALHMERDEVFAATHTLVFQLLRRGRLDGLRIDHSDGLFSPSAYFERLQKLYAEACPTARDGLYVVVEKILAPHERLRPHWAVSGTTGYEFANLLNGLFVDAGGMASLEKTYRSFTRERRGFDEILYQSKVVIMKTALASELNVLANHLSRIAELDSHTRDYTLNSLRIALLEIVASFPVYRTYIGEENFTDDDRRQVEWACAVARKKARVADTSTYDFIRNVLLGTIAEGKNEAYRNAATDFAMRFQQFTSPVMAKGMEDTAFYRFVPLVSVNDVGGDPRRATHSLTAFHLTQQERARDGFQGMLATSTHDSKRGEDVRARIDVLAEMPDEWRRALMRWHRINRTRFGDLDGMPVPTRRDEYLLYQTLIGTWPDAGPQAPEYRDYLGRIAAYMTKAVREAKEWSSWIHPNLEYEAQMTRFIESALDAVTGQRFLAEFGPFASLVAHFGRINSLAQTVLKLTVPGVPDLYQGSELWNLRLVDPDNRRPVDYGLRRDMLAALRGRENESGVADLSLSLLDDAASGLLKMFVTWKLLQLRKAHRELFGQGEYLPLNIGGEKAAHVCAFARRRSSQVAVVVVPRLPCTLAQAQPIWPTGAQVWTDTRIDLPFSTPRWSNVLTSEEIAAEGVRRERHLPVSAVLGRFPVAVLVPADGAASPFTDPVAR